MATATRMTVNGGSNGATLEILVDGAVETTYTYEANAFTLSERASDVTLSKDDLASLISDIAGWVTAVTRYCGIVYDEFAPHQLDADDKANRVVLKLKFGDATAVHAVVQKASPDVEFKARPALTLTPYEFTRFRKVLAIVPAIYAPYFLFSPNEA